MADIDISTLNSKVQNEGSTDAGRLTAEEWNSLVNAVIKNERAVKGTIKGIIYKDGPEKGGQLFTEIDERGYLKMNPADPQGDITMNITDEPAKYIAKGGECKVSFTVNSKTADGKSSQIPCEVKYYVKNSTNVAIDKTLVGSATIYDYAYGNAMGYTKSLTFDFGKANLAIGDFDNVLTIEVNNGMGKTYTQIFTVRVIDLTLNVYRFNEKNVYTDKEGNEPILEVMLSNGEGKVNAAVDGTTILSNANTLGGGIRTTYSSNIFEPVNKHGVHNLEVWATLTKDYLKENEDGTSSIEQIVITTDTKKYTYIYGESNDSFDPVVIANIANKTPEEYSNFNIGYTAYKYNRTENSIQDNITVRLYEYKGIDEDGNYIIDKSRVLDSISQLVTFDASTKSANGNVTMSLFPKTIEGETNSIRILGDFIVSIGIGEYEYLEKITVVESSIQLRENNGYAVKLVSSGRSNYEPETTLRKWTSVGTDAVAGLAEPTIANMIFDNNVEFIDTGSGWVYDGIKYDPNDPNDKGNMALHLRKGSTCKLDYKPFSKNPTYLSGNNNGQNRGLTISVEFATRNCLNQNASVISCVDFDNNGKKRGFEVLANKATLYANTFDMFAEFKEDTRIKLDIVIEGSQTEYFYSTVTGTGKEGDEVKEYDNESSKEALAIIYIDGVYQALALIPEGTSFMQKDGGKEIEFGSNDCDLDIYSIRIYNTALNPMQIVENYAYDTPNIKEKMAIASRNYDVLIAADNTPINKPNINIAGLTSARPELPLFYVEMDNDADPAEVLPKDKSDWKLMKLTQFVNPANNDSLVEAAPSFEIEYSVMRNQGTSSMTYPWPWRNWDWKSKDSDFPQGKGKYSIPTLASPVHSGLSYWPLYKGMYDIASDGAGGLKKITFKKDYASSEMCNNAITSEMFTDMAIGIGDAIPEVLSLAQRSTHSLESPTPYRLTFKAIPCFMFRKYSDKYTGKKNETAGEGVEALGMMNMIPNKNECVHLGFDKTWTWETSRAQSWELADNYPEWFWTKRINGVVRESDSVFSNDIKKLYEARYPKDSTVKWETGDESDFGMLYDDQKKLSEAEQKALHNEQSDLIKFHNWLVDCNRQIAINYKNENGNWRELTPEEQNYDWNKDENGGYNKWDTPEYRLNKFTAEARDYMIVEQFALYYIWREMFWAYDSGFKNLQIYTMGQRPGAPSTAPMQWGCMVRDADTTLGIQNQGRSEFPPYLEDTDYYNEVNGEKIWHFDALKDCYDESDIIRIGGESAKHVLNGQLGALWINLRDAFSGDIAKVYRTLVSRSNKTNWNSSKAIKRFRDHQEKWCESLYNFGMRQYFGGTPFSAWITSGLGDKKNSRASWLDKAFYYRNTKYKALGADDFAAFRAGCYETPDIQSGNTLNETVDLKLYQPMYLCLNANTQDPTQVLVHKRITDVDNPVKVAVNDNGFGFPLGFNSAVAWQFGTTNMIEIGDLARVCKIYEIQSWNFPKLRKLELGHEPARDNVEYQEYITETVDGKPVKRGVPISNSNLSKLPLDTFKQLQILDITNHRALPAEINASYCNNLQEIYAQGCYNTTSIILPNTTTLNTIYLPSSMNKIALNGLTGIRNFVLEAETANRPYTIESLQIVNCGKKGSYMSTKSYSIVSQVLTSLLNSYDPDDNAKPLELTDVYWKDKDADGNGIRPTADFLEKLLSINASITGEIHVKDHISLALKKKLVDAYGAIDNPDNPLYITYEFRTITGLTMANKLYLHELGKSYDLSEYLSVNPIGANTYDRSEWTFANGSTTCAFGSIDKSTGVFTRNSEIDTNKTPIKVYIKVYQIPDANGKERDVLDATCDLYFYERIAKPGDIVFNDGSYSDELISGKTPIGVCFYVRPVKDSEGNVVSYNRLMMSTDSISLYGYPVLPWGMGPGGMLTGDQNEYYGTDQNIKISTDLSYECFDIEKLYNITSYGANITGTDTILSNDNYRDISNVANDKFKNFTSGCLAEIGWADAEYNLAIDNLNLPNGDKAIYIKKGDSLPIGYYNTLAIIEHRNKILDDYNARATEDGNPDHFIRPAAKYNNDGTIQRTESEVLSDLINENGNKAVKWPYEGRESSKVANGKTYGNTLYYPAASACFAYEPEAANLDDKFKKYNWFLPAAGDVVRMLYYCYNANSDEISNFDDDKSFKNALSLNVLSLNNFYGSSVNYIATSSEHNRVYVWAINSTDGSGISNHTKYSSGYIRPICRF